MRTVHRTLCLIVLCVLGCIKAEAAVPLPEKQVTEKVDRLIRSLQTLTGEKRKQAISDLYEIGASKDGNAILYFGCNVTRNADGTTTLSRQPERNAVLSKVIPVLISEIDDDEGVDNKAWWILIALQTDCPRPKREVWEKWWKQGGSKLFAPTPGR